MIIFLFIALPIVVQISGVILGAPRKTSHERHLFWVSCVGLVLFIGGYLVGLIGDQVYRKTYNEPFAMGPITEIGSVALVAGVLLAVIGIAFQIRIGLTRLARRTQSKNFERTH